MLMFYSDFRGKAYATSASKRAMQQLNSRRARREAGKGRLDFRAGAWKSIKGGYEVKA